MAVEYGLRWEDNTTPAPVARVTNVSIEETGTPIRDGNDLLEYEKLICVRKINPVITATCRDPVQAKIVYDATQATQKDIIFYEYGCSSEAEQVEFKITNGRATSWGHSGPWGDPHDTTITFEGETLLVTNLPV